MTLTNNCIPGFGSYRDAVDRLIDLHNRKQKLLFDSDSSPYRQEEQSNLYDLYNEIVRELEASAQNEETEFANHYGIENTESFLAKLGKRLQ
jgi:hypothetical protein